MCSDRSSFHSVLRAIHRPSADRPRSRHRAPLGRLLDELRELLRRYGNVAASSERGVGFKTRRERRIVMTRMLIDMFRAGYRLTSLKNFGKRHVLVILGNWHASGYASSTMATYVSHLRTFCLWLGKPHLLQFIEEYVDANPGLTARRTATDRDKSERATGVSFEEILRRAGELGDKHFCCQLVLICALGLRSREAWLFRPHLAEVADSPGRIYVGWGTKGGRSRVVPISEENRVFLEWAKQLVLSRPESMVPRAYTLKQWGYRYYRLCHRIGFTRRDLGITPHSLRHGFLLDLYEKLTGLPAPVRARDRLSPELCVDRAAREIVSEVAGHSRTSVVSAYLGSTRISI